MSKPKFITLEGGEGVGKTTNLSFIRDYLVDHGVDFIVTREPGGTMLGEKMREILLDQSNKDKINSEAELLIMFAARAQHLQDIIYPALKDGRWVVCDRFTDASYAYQGAGRDIPAHRIQALENWLQADFRPDLTLLLDAAPEVGIQRAENRGEKDRFESENIDFFNRVREAYLARAAMAPDRYCVVNADQALQEVQAEIGLALDKLML